MKLHTRLRPFLHNAVPRWLFQSGLAVFLLSSALSASAGDCDAVYSVVDKHGKLFLPCVQLNDGTVYQADLDQLPQVEQFLFTLKTAAVTMPSADQYATFNQETGLLHLPVVETNLGGQQKFYTVEMTTESQSAEGDFIFGISAVWCLANLTLEESAPSSNELDAGKSVTLSWPAQNTSSACNATNHRLAFHHAMFNGEHYFGKAFGAAVAPPFTVGANDSSEAKVKLVVPERTGDFTVYFDVVDGNGTPLPTLLEKPSVSFTVVASTGTDEPPDDEPVKPDEPVEPTPPAMTSEEMDDATIAKDNVAPGQLKKIAVDEVELEVSTDAVDIETFLGIKPLDDTNVDMPSLDPGMVNVTKGKKGFRFLPHGMKFKKKVKVRMPYNKQRLPAWKTEEDIRTYYFDETTGRWVPLERVTIDTKTQEIISHTDHFTDMINAVVTVPDAPESVSFNPTQIKDIKAADPGAGVNLIEVPQANNMGDMRLSYPLEVPPGRVGMQPQLGVQYNSGGGNGWMGLGWDLSMQAVGIDTRWGVPRYDAALETETYMLSGQQLTPIVHRNELKPRTADKIFHTRVEGGFMKIIRHGNSPKNYWWETVDKNGTVSYYGGNADTVLTDDSGNIFKWALREVRDTHGNNMQYRYVRVMDVGVSGGSVPGYELYLKTVHYTGYNDEAGPYKVTFIRDRELGEARRADVTISGRGGFKQVTADLLRKVDITFDDAPVRSYVFKYQEGAFRKTLLASITQYGENGSAFHTHTFDYYNDAAGGLFGPTTTWNTGSDGVAAGLLGQGKASAISGNKSDSIGGHLYLGINLLIPDKKMSVGGKIGYSATQSDGLLIQLDINGDGLPDKVYKKGSGIYYRANQSGPNGGTQFGPSHQVGNLSDISKGSSRMVSGGAELYMGVSVGFNIAGTFNKTTVYFVDVNSDGLPDIANNGGVLFNHLDSNGEPYFSSNNADTPYPIGGGAVDTANLLENYDALREKFIDNFPLLDTIRRWVAPYDGQVRISGDVALIEDTSPERQQYATADGVRVAIQHNNNSELWATEIDADDYASKTPTGINAITVKKADVIYFRVQSRFDGAYDQVSWTPDIQYLNVSPSVDANNLDVYHYNAADDFALAGYQGMFVNMPVNGKVQITGELQKLGTTTDDVTLQLIKNDGVVYQQTLSWDQVGTFVLSQEIAVAKEDRIAVHVNIDSPIDLTQLQWRADVPLELFYVSSPDLDTVTDADGNPVAKNDLVCGYDIYPATNLAMPLATWTVPATQTYTVNPLLALNPLLPEPVNASITMTVKKAGELLGKHTITITNSVIENGSFEIAANQGDKLYFEFNSLDAELVSTLTQIAAGVTATAPNSPTYSVPTEFHSAGDNLVIPLAYRGWNVFGYDGNRERAESPIEITEADLTAENAKVALEGLQTKAENATLDSIENESTAQMPTLKVISYYPKRNRWQSPDDNAWVQADTLSSSRNGLDNFDVPSPSTFAGARSVIKLSDSKQMSVMLGVSFVSGSMSRSNSSGYLDFFDMNGDRFPDILSGCGVQYTTMLGGLEGACRGVLSGDLRATQGNSFNFGVGGNYPLTKTGGSGRTGSTSNQMASLGLSGNLTKGDSETKYDIIDVNGDGLPDRVSGGLNVALNLGYRFAPAEPWGGAAINENDSLGLSLGGSAGMNDGINGFAGGISLSRSFSESAKLLLDANGDGLLDAVSGSGVRFNTGNGFGGGSGALGDKVTSSDTSMGGGVYFTIGIPIGLPPLGFYIIINPGFDVNRSMSRQEVSFSDIDGDGYPDRLKSDKDNSVNVATSQIRRTNLLKTVHRPLGATITVDYARTGNTYEQPHNRWVMSRVAVNDGHPGDGVDVQVKTYHYADGFYHRQERDFYGYRLVVEEHRDHSQADQLYRSITRVFHNDSYYNKGLLVTETTADADGNKYLETENTYFLRNIDTGNELVSLNHLTATVFPELRRVDQRFYEGHAEPGKATYTLNTYDALGNIIHFVDAADVGAQDDVEADIGYFSDAANYIVGKAKSIVVKGNGTVMRRREAEFESGTGNLTQVRIYLADGNAAVTDLDYDQYGNLNRLTGTANYQGQRYHLEYAYDEQVHTHNVSVTDSFGYVSTARYNLKYGKVENTTDINNNPLDYTYDPFGRVATIVGPYQTNSGLDTIRFAYHPNADEPWALTQHIDVYREVNDPIETVLFTDGLKRVLQTKKDATIHTSPETAAQAVMTVSGHITFDFIGRGIAQYYPITEALGSQGVFNPAVDSVQPTVTTYDVLDRNIRTTIPDNTSTEMAYGFGLDRNGQRQFLTRVTDANEISKETYKDVRGVITAVKEFNDGGEQILWTSYEYDPLKQIVRVIDDQHNLTQVDYDNLGRRTHIDNPDMGLTETVYDLASNVTQKITANLRAEGLAIVYQYDYNRLQRISYPPRMDDKDKTVFPSIDVHYTYGEPGAAYNRANRIITVADQSGLEERFYGPLGETVKTIKTVASDTEGNSPNSPEVYTTEYVFDTWNRLQSLIYPDGEVLTNHYDSGGAIRAAEGQKAQHHYTYLTRLEYDKFGQRQLVELGNNVQTRYSYNPLNRRLATLQTGKEDEETGLEVLFQDLTYLYDNVGNILGQANLAAVESPSKMGGETHFQYEYDDLYRLVHAEGTFDYQPSKQHRYQLDMVYDSIHNIRAKTQLHTLRQPSKKPITQKKTTYDWQYAYEGAQPHAPTHLGEQTFSYDANGNQTGWEDDRNANRRTIVWDEENRIQSISDNGHTKTYKYNDAGQRVIKRGHQGETAYVNPFFVIRNREGGTKHIYAGAMRLVSKLMKQDKPGKNPNGKVPLEKDLYYYHPDHLGSSAYVSDTQGKLFQHLEYFPFGETFVEQSSNTQRTPYRFTAKEFDEETGLYYFGARYYDPRTSVWQSPDPILAQYLPTGNNDLVAGGVFNSPNLGMYSYAHLNPVVYKDPDGNSVVKAAKTAFKLVWRAYRTYRKTGKLDAKALKRIGLDELVGIASDLVTIFDGDAGLWERLGAATDLVVGTEFNNKGNKKVLDLADSAKNKLTKKWSRKPKSIQDQMTLKAAKEGQGNVIIKPLNDPKFKGMEKMELKVKSVQGRNSVVHYVRDPKTGKGMDFKFKKHSTGEIP